MTAKTSPIFFIVSKGGYKRSTVLGVFCQDYLGGRPATPEESAAIKPRVIASGTESLRDAIIEGTYKPFRVWDTRKEARAAGVALRKSNSCFDWAIVQVGNEQRDLSNPPKGYQIVFGDCADTSYANPAQAAPLVKGGEYYERYFTTRGPARARLAEMRAEDAGMGYRLRTLYA